ncbi:MAG TPA: hypothetical protein ENI96_09910 [Sedimenticola thiotaurini]|uniref:Uncharacterized protein n=1 Tax=Sedimenticola thiotaurini TaxID=1543721 RepID=A0A831RQA5_9GAMM|nr:hypothetical protein [Sedimenticola thiotaurini]
MHRELMLDFARRTGLSPASSAPRRYLWTDAFAVCNLLGLYRDSGDDSWLGLARSLVDQVHHTLGRFRPDDERRGWISGLSDREGERHPTIGGLRIGKSLAERGPDQPYDEALEWDRDGQYFHYLTKWMHALHRMGRVTGEADYHRWAVELAHTACDRFVHRSPVDGRWRMYWKMSTDLTRPLVPSMGQHDPLDGYVTLNQLQHCPPEAGAEVPDLAPQIARFGQLCAGQRWATDDALGIGGLLWDAWRLVQLGSRCGHPEGELAGHLLQDALAGLRAFSGTGEARLPAAYRLPFREFGLAIGLAAVERLHRHLERDDGGTTSPQGVVGVLMGYRVLAVEIEQFWSDPGNQAAATWREHLDINAVMLATLQAPEGFLTI